MKKVMPNDKCPCMSGKKYKFCCAKNKEFLEELENITGGDYIDSNYIFSDIFKKSNNMKKYIQNMMSQLNMNIIFSRNSKLDANMRTLGTNDNKIGIIIIKEVPISERDYFDLAHEIGHLYYSIKGYPKTFPKEKNMTSLCTVLTNTIMDPMINRMLYSYGFDFITYLKKAISIQGSIFRNYPNESDLALFQRHFLKCLIIEKELEWDILDAGILENDFKKIYEVKYPILFNEAKEFIAYAKEKGMDTASKVKEEIIRLRSDNKMEQYIEIM